MFEQPATFTRDGATIGRLAADLTAPVVGVGEATHGSREFVTTRARLTRELCARGHRVVALEAGAGRVRALDRYVAGGKTGDEPELADALAELPAFWRTEAFAACCRSLREANRAAGDSARIRIVGVDVDDPGVLADAIRAVIRRGSDETRVPAAVETLADDPGSLAGAVSAERIDRAERAVAAARDVLGEDDTLTLDDSGGTDDARAADDETRDGETAEYGGAASPGTESAAYLVDALDRTVAWLRAGGATGEFEPTAMGDRDRMMAENAAGFADHGVVFWAHTVHVQRGTFDDGTAWADQPTAGDRLADRSDYRAVGTDFAVGGFRAGTPDTDGLAACRVDEPVERTVAACHRENAPCVVDPADESADRLRAIGLAFDPDDEPRVVETDLAASLDRVIAFDEVTATRPFDAE